MFALRDRGDTESVLALAQGFNDTSALFRHEIGNTSSFTRLYTESNNVHLNTAYIFGQMVHEASIPSLISRLRDEGEAGMVRHEAAEALGAIATSECREALEACKEDGVDVVRESCEVGLDMVEYEESGEFQYAIPLLKTMGDDGNASKTCLVNEE